MKPYTYSEKAIIDIMAKLERLGRDVASRIETPVSDDESEKKFWNAISKRSK